MTTNYALHSVIYMIGFVILFDRMHHRHNLTRWLRGSNLMGQDELQRLQAILAACQEN